jgi:hypothetical protein
MKRGTLVKRRRREARAIGRAPRGVAVVIVLGLLAIALTVSYAMLRSQTTSVLIHGNLSRRANSRQAALAGISAALRKMHQSDWRGVETSMSGRIDEREWFEVQFQTGDDSLTPLDPDYAEFPYRVTILSNGYADDSGNLAARSMHQIRAVVQLARRKLADVPANWGNLQKYNIYQWSDQDAYVEVPVRSEGPVLLQGRLRLCSKYPPDALSRQRYLADLEARRLFGAEDFRPFSGPVYLPYGRNTSETLSLLQVSLRVQTNNIAAANSAPLSHPGTINSYRLYAGGKQYEVPTLQSQFGFILANVSVQPDPKTNPLGVYRSAGGVVLNDNVSIRGTLIVDGWQPDVHIYGSNVHFRAVDLPQLEGSPNTIQLPALIIKDDLRVYEKSRGGSLTGMAVVWNDFEFREGEAGVSFDVRGRVLTRKLRLFGRESWNLDSSTWSKLLGQFLSQLNDSKIASRILFFPDWLEAKVGLKAKPLLTIKPQDDSVSYHWQDWTQPIFVPHPLDPGLRWNLIDLRDDPYLGTAPK